MIDFRPMENTMKNFDSYSQPLQVLGRRILPCVAAVICAFAGQAGAQTAGTPAHSSPMIYPAQGQSARQQDRDKYECHDWARGQTGYDPTQLVPPTTNAQPSPPSQPKPSQSAAGSMAAGAMSGAAIAELTHNNAGRGAAAGALGGAMLQRVKQQQSQSQQMQQQAAQQHQAGQQQAAQQQARNQQRAAYERALSACMEGRGYTVK